MQYTSTRNQTLSVTASFAIANGISAEGGLFVPAEWPSLSQKEIADMTGFSYAQCAEKILSLFLTDFTDEELHAAVTAAYTGGAFENDSPAVLAPLPGGAHMLELWHGPTCAFKDMALQLTPRLMTLAASRAPDIGQILILVATSGDTGKAALEGFKNVPGVKIAVFYPNGGVSEMQRLQMASQDGENVAVFAIEGNFDCAQTEVKRIFTDKSVVGALAARKTVLSSANSINWGRLVPQIVYYFTAYAQLLKTGRIRPGEKINFAVPTGNFGNILAGYYARRMGLPVNRLICASNRNNVLTDFIRTGEYDARRPFFATLSPSMDILISSNLERLLFELSGRDSESVRNLMQRLSSERRYALSSDWHRRLGEAFWGGCLDDEGCQNIIAETFSQSGRLVDPHTAVALGVYAQYRNATKDETPAVVLSTASPYKFCRAVLGALGQDQPDDEFAAVAQLAAYTKSAPPAPIAALKNAKARFHAVLKPGDMADAVVKFAG
jgi:threonine synthase